MNRGERSAAVIGAGIAGLSAAYDLQRAGFRTVVFEERDRVGGRIWSIRKGDFLMDLGAAFYLGTYTHTIAMIHELRLSDSFQCRPAMGAVRRDGTMHWLDYTTPIRTGLRTGLISQRSKLKAWPLAQLVIKHRKDLGYDSYETLAALDTETLLTHEYLNAHEHLSDAQVTEYAVDRASEYYGDIAADVEETACVRWHASVPAMQLGRFRRMAEYHRNLDRHSPVQLAGDFDRIPGLNGALMSGRDAARRLRGADAGLAHAAAAANARSSRGMSGA